MADIPHNIGALQPLAMKLARPVFRFFWRLNVSGLENIPGDGPALICPNHLAAFDSFVLPTALPRGITYLGKAEYLDDWKTARLFPALGMIPVDRRGGSHAHAGLNAARSVLRLGGLFGLYPEGTRSRSGNLHKGHTGAARLALETGAPIVPVGLVGTERIQPPGRAVPKLFRTVTINIGRPIDVSRYRGRVGDRAVYREITDEVMYEIRDLSGLDYVNLYSNSAPRQSVTDVVPEDDPGFEPAYSGPAIRRVSSRSVLESPPL